MADKTKPGQTEIEIGVERENMNDEKSEVKHNFKEWEFILEEKERLIKLEDLLNERIKNLDLQAQQLKIAQRSLESYETNIKAEIIFYERIANALERIGDKL